MIILKHKHFHQWAKSEGISDLMLIETVQELNLGLCEANLGAGLYKKRIARKGYGKSGGYRTLLAFKLDDIVIFLYGFAKNEKSNISEKEKSTFKKLSKQYLGLTKKELNKLITAKKLIEVIT